MSPMDGIIVDHASIELADSAGQCGGSNTYKDPVDAGPARGLPAPATTYRKIEHLSECHADTYPTLANPGAVRAFRC